MRGREGLNEKAFGTLVEESEHTLVVGVVLRCLHETLLNRIVNHSISIKMNKQAKEKKAKCCVCPEVCLCQILLIGLEPRPQEPSWASVVIQGGSSLDLELVASLFKEH